MPITAAFSNGHVDVYKGKRNVRAAWMITRKSDGVVLASGHSIDRRAAEKTAAGAVAENHGAGPGLGPIWAPRGHTSAHIVMRARSARSAGWDGKGKADNFIRTENARRKALRDASVVIEVIDL